MAETVVLINGLPGAGKTTLGRALRDELDLPLVSKDDLKEAFADIARKRLDSVRLGQLASETLWDLVAALPGAVLAESWWFAPRDRRWVEAGLARSGAPRTLEVWCDVPPQLAWARYAARRRHPVHPDADAARAGWAAWDGGAEPLGLGPVLRVDTTREVDVAALGERIRAALA